MPVSESLRRLLRVRELEEEQRRAALESAVEEQRRLESAFAAARARERTARHHIAAGASDPVNRIASLVESDSARRHAAALDPRVTAAEVEAARLRVEFLSRRTERRQVETLIAETESQDALIESRRQQQRVDDAHAVRKSRSAK